MNGEQYLLHNQDIDLAKVKKIRRLIEPGLESLIGARNPKTKLWPLYLDNGLAHHPSTMSITTTVMILHVLGVGVGSIQNSVLTPNIGRWHPRLELRQDRKDTVAEATADVIAKILENRSTVEFRDLKGEPYEEAVLTNSKTWGVNDPLTLTWLHEVLLQDSKETKSPAAIELDFELIGIARRRVATGFADPRRFLQVNGRGGNPFKLLRLVLSAKSIGYLDNPDGPLTELVNFLKSTLHTELSKSAIRDGNFDPSVLVFALEALVLVSPAAVRDELVDRVIEVLASDRRRSSHWRPVVPIQVTAWGAILLPQSVEVANSYLRIGSLRDDGTTVPLFSRSEELLEHFVNWICSRSIRVSPLHGNCGPTFQGWQSEHVFADGRIDLWATTQVLLFLQYYSSMLENHIARSSRLDAAIDFEKWDRIDAEDWGTTRSHEPMKTLGESRYQVLGQVERRVVQPRLEGFLRRTRGADPQSPAPGFSSPATPRPACGHSAASAPAGPVEDPWFSLLLYGPPGTGKTAFARSLARAVGYDFINVTPTDFTRAGEAGVEERAQALFKVLLAQSEVVILFDEIDRLVLDRDGDLYGRQSDTFQFMTPSMLTKLNELRGKKRCIFIIASNYAERIDGAIKRAGRIDARLLLLPPDLAQRKTIITCWLGKHGEVTWPDDTVLAIAQATPLYVFKELIHVIEELSRKVPKGTADGSFRKALKSAVKEFPPNITLGQYQERLWDRVEKKRRPGFEKGPWEEFGLLTYLVLEAEDDHTKLPKWAKAIITKIYSRFEDDPDILHRLEKATWD